MITCLSDINTDPRFGSSSVGPIIDVTPYPRYHGRMTKTNLPTARCVFCRASPGCPDLDRGRSEVYPACYQDRRLLDLRSVEAHFTAMRDMAGLNSGRVAVPYKKMERHLCAHLERVMTRYAFCLEYSFAWRGDDVFPYRFSISFPAFARGAAALDLTTLRVMLAAFGSEVSVVAEPLLRAADPGVTPQLLFGLEAGPQARRFKLYWQFPPGCRREKEFVLNRLLSTTPDLGDSAALSRLHLIGADFCEQGLLRVKTYERISRWPLVSLKSRYPDWAMMDEITHACEDNVLRDAVIIQRFRPDGYVEIASGAELDFNAPLNGLTPERLEAYTESSEWKSALNGWRNLCGSRRMGMSRLSLVQGDSTRGTLYYVPVDPP